MTCRRCMPTAVPIVSFNPNPYLREETIMYKKQVTALILAAAFCTTVRGTTLVQSTFDSDDEGWSAVSIPNPPAGVTPNVAMTYAVTYSATGGNPGGDISEVDQDANDYYFKAPTKFLGNQSAALGGTFSFSIADGPVTFFNADESPLILVGSTESIYFPDNTSVTPTFSTLSFTLATGYGGAVNGQGGAAATLSDFTAVLSNLQAVYVLGDYYNGGDTAMLDNVVLGVPEPVTTAMVGLGMAAGAAWFLKRRRRRPVNLV